MTSLAARTRRVARSFGPDHPVRRLVLPGGMIVFAAGVGRRSVALATAGAFMVGWAVNPDPDRHYLEGFSDGIRIAPELEAGAAAPAVPAPGFLAEPAAGLPALPPADLDVLDIRAFERAGTDQRGAGDGGPRPLAGSRVVLGVPVVDRRPGAAFRPDGDPVLREAVGPRPSTFPIPAAHASGGPGPGGGRQNGSAPGSPPRRGRRTSEST